ncbi:42058_t:CDS:1, partial [Gigaspora margarita]
NKIFQTGQSYVALSHCTKWEHVKIHKLNHAVFMTDLSMVNEYEQLEDIARNPLPLNRT